MNEMDHVSHLEFFLLFYPLKGHQTFEIIILYQTCAAPTGIQKNIPIM